MSVHLKECAPYRRHLKECAPEGVCILRSVHDRQSNKTKGEEMQTYAKQQDSEEGA